MKIRQEGLSKEIIDIARQVQRRLRRRYQRSIYKGKHINVVVTGIAREIIAYIWAISQEEMLSRVDNRLRIAKKPSRKSFLS
jgi:hypothetical protein